MVNGLDGNDTLELNGTNTTARGGIGDDTISSVNVLNGVVEGGAGNDDISFTPLRPSDALTGDEEEDTSRVDGGAGNDTISHNSFDSNVEQLTGANIDGGAGDDTITNDIYIGSDADTVEDTLTGGLGADSFFMSFFNDDVDGDARDAGLLATITDFDTDEDVLFLTSDVERATSEGDNVGVVGRINSFELIEAADGSYTDVVFEAAGAATDTNTVTGTIRLAGTIGVTDANIKISRSAVAATT